MLNIISHEEMQIKTAIRYHYTPLLNVDKDVEKLKLS